MAQLENLEKNIADLSTSEILTGVFIYLPKDYSFTEQKIYRFFRTLESSNIAMRGRYHITKSKIRRNYLKSEQIRRFISFLEIGNLLQNSWNSDLYSINNSMLYSIKKDLRERNVFPSYKLTFKKLAEDFIDA